MKKTKLKINFFHALIVLSLPLGLFLAQGLINSYWLPPEIRQFLSPPKFSSGQCIKSDWAINPKIVVGYKIQKNQIYYLFEN